MRRAGLACALLALGGCERPAPIGAAAESAQAPVAAADSVVRRVTRYRKVASAIQRVTGPIAGARAERQLDSVLAVRALDARGAEVPGVAVGWTLGTAAGGARLTVVDQVTDSGGVSRATFVPGRSAAAQVVSAEVAGVGRIDFEVRIPVAQLRVEAPAAVWADEAVVVSAVLADPAGVPLEGGTVQWATTDSSALRLQPSDSQRTVVAGALAGRAEIWAWSGNTRGTARVLVRPVLDVAVAALDDSLPGASLAIESPRAADVPRVAGRFRAPLDVQGEDEVVLRITPAQRDRYHGARLRTANARDLQSLRVLLIPTRWRIDAGTFSGQEVAIDAGAALEPVAGRAPFWRLAPVSGRGLKTLLGWHTGRLPIPIAFDRARSAAPVSAADSAAFWDIARVMERDLGETLFRPAQDADSTAVRVEVRSQPSAGHTFVSWTQDGDANDGTLVFRSSSLLGDSHVVTHELLHLLGFGHSVSWSSVAVPADGREPRLTPTDVAYVQLALRLRRRGLRIGFPRLP